MSIAISEHHASPDGYVPSPLLMTAAMAARTTNVRFAIAALIAPFYDPIRLAEDAVVLDHLSRGRVDLIVGGGYVREEFAMYGVPMNERVARVTEVVSTLKGAFTGQPFEFRGRTVRITPPPFRPGGPAVWDFYRDEVIKLGRPDPGPSPTGQNRIIALADDADAGWAAMGSCFLHENNAYGAWQAQDDVASPYHSVSSGDTLRASGDYAVLRPEEYIAELRAATFPFAFLHPLCGGRPIDLAWASLRLFEREVLPAFA